MRKVRAVYVKLKDVKHLHLVKLYKKFLRKAPENCMYNYRYVISDKAAVGLCFLHQPDANLKSGIFPHLIEVCQDVQHCKNCNAFIPRLNKKNIQEHFEGKLRNKKLKEREYPDICALEWVLERSALGIPPFDFMQKRWFSIKRWLSKNKVL